MTCLHSTLNTSYCNADPTHIPMTWDETACNCNSCLTALAAEKEASATAWKDYQAEQKAGAEAQAAIDEMLAARQNRNLQRIIASQETENG